MIPQLSSYPAFRRWAGEMTLEEVYQQCPRADWLVWLFKQRNPNEDKFLGYWYGVRIQRFRHLLKCDVDLQVMNTAIAYGEGRIGKDEVVSVYNAARNHYKSSYSSVVELAESYKHYIDATLSFDKTEEAANLFRTVIPVSVFVQ